MTAFILVLPPVLSLLFFWGAYRAWKEKSLANTNIEGIKLAQTPEAAKAVSVVLVFTGIVCLAITPLILAFSINSNAWAAIFGMVWGVFYLGISWAKRKHG